MMPKIVVLSLSLALLVPIARAVDTTPLSVKISAPEIVSRNIVARGGLQAWRSVSSISMEGKLGAGGNQRAHIEDAPPGKKLTVIPTDPRPKEEVQLPFTLDLQRPHKERIELLFKGKTALQVYDGNSGWKLRPYLNRMEVEAFSEDELKASSTQAELDGYLIDYASKGTRIKLEGMEKVEGRDTYNLKLILKSGQVFYVWIDAQTYLEAKIEGLPRRLDDVEHPVEVYYRDYRTVNGLQIPFVLETRVLPVTVSGRTSPNPPVQFERIVIENVTVNPKFDASLFAKPMTETAAATNLH